MKIKKNAVKKIRDNVTVIKEINVTNYELDFEAVIFTYWIYFIRCLQAIIIKDCTMAYCV